jgi:capsular polysaccharide transport system permease protein
MNKKVRTPWQVTRSVWYALFLRESLSRTTADRFAWFWMILEPAALIIIMVLIRTVVLGKSRHIAGAEFISWFVVGLFAFHLYRENMMKLIGAIESNRALFAYRQVKPIDTVIVRSFVETLLKTFLFALFIVLGFLFDINLISDDIICSMYLWVIIWLMGLGSGLILSAISTIYPEVGKLVKIMSFPLLLISGVIFPIHFLPMQIQEYLLINPIAHAVELFRGSFFSNYHMVDGVSYLYTITWLLAGLLIGLILQIKNEEELKAK